jgi:hypothetical protein
MVLFYLFLTKIKQIRLICSILILIEANKVILLKKQMSIELSEEDLNEITEEITTQQKEFGIVKMIHQEDKTVTVASLKEQYEARAMNSLMHDLSSGRGAGILTSRRKEDRFGRNSYFNPVTSEHLFAIEYMYKTSFSK